MNEGRIHFVTWFGWKKRNQEIGAARFPAPWRSSWVRHDWWWRPDCWRNKCDGAEQPQLEVPQQIKLVMMEALHSCWNQPWVCLSGCQSGNFWSIKRLCVTTCCRKNFPTRSSMLVDTFSCGWCWSNIKALRVYRGSSPVSKTAWETQLARWICLNFNLFQQSFCVFYWFPPSILLNNLAPMPAKLF